MYDVKRGNKEYYLNHRDVLLKQAHNYYQDHSGEIKKYKRKYREKHREEIRIKDRARYRLHIFDKRKASLENHRKHRQQRLVSMRKQVASLKIEVLRYYSPELKCMNHDCLVIGGCRNIRALSIDHINDDGYRHRKEIGRSATYYWLRRNNYPKGFQVLCMNCQLIKEIVRRERVVMDKYYSSNMPRSREYHKKLKFKVMIHYSSEMKCQNPKCLVPNGCRDIRCLSIDHINGCGKKLRDEQGSGAHLYSWIIKNGFPDGFQVLCMNCQWIQLHINELEVEAKEELGKLGDEGKE